MRLLPLGAACDRKLSQYRAALDAGADPTVLPGWITRTQAERVPSASRFTTYYRQAYGVLPSHTLRE